MINYNSYINLHSVYTNESRSSDLSHGCYTKLFLVQTTFVFKSQSRGTHIVYNFSLLWQKNLIFTSMIYEVTKVLIHYYYVSIRQTARGENKKQFTLTYSSRVGKIFSCFRANKKFHFCVLTKKWGVVWFNK